MSNMPFIAHNEERQKELRDRRDGILHLRQQGKNSNFIGVRLLKMYTPDWRECFGPVKDIRVTRARIGIAGNQYQLNVQVVDKYIFFDWDPQLGQHIAWFYDDEESYNRQVLATHFYNDTFEIMDEKIRNVIEVIAKQKKKEGHKVEGKQEAPLTEEDTSKMSTEMIDEQIAFLQKQKENIVNKDDLPEPEATVVPKRKKGLAGKKSPVVIE